MDFSIRRDKGGRIIWSQDQIDYIINEYSINFNTGFIAKQFNVSAESIRRILRKNNIKILSAYEQGVRKYPRDTKAFSKYTREEAYWLGFLYADGNISDNNEIQISLADSDIQQLQNFKEFLHCENNKITNTQKIKEGKLYKGVQFQIRDKFIASSLKKRGMIPRKSLILTFPTEEQVSKEHIWDFIRGYFDGDGCISFDKRENWLIDFIGTLDMMENIKKYSHKDSIKIEKIGNEKSNTYRFRISGNKNVKDVLNNMYRNSTEKTRLERKYKKYLEYINYCA